VQHMTIGSAIALLTWLIVHIAVLGVICSSVAQLDMLNRRYEVYADLVVVICSG
jgi:hypothetical protein